MTQFGQNLLPSIYEDNTFRTFSKSGMLSHLVRALQTVGMIPLTSTWPFDPIANPEFPIVESQIYIFPFDFPDDGGTLTFNVNGTLYRVCMAIVLGHGNENATTNVGRQSAALLWDACVRVDGPVSMENIFPASRSRGSTGLSGFGIPTSQTTITYPNQGGGIVQKEDWLPNVGSSALNNSVLPIGHWFVHLGPAGLFIYAGGGSSRAAFGDVLAGAMLFSGARLPGRARPVLEDSNLNRINPTVTLWFREINAIGGGSSFYSTTTEPLYARIFRPKIHRMQSDLKFTDVVVDAWLFNLENVEYPIFPLYQPDTRPSPREIASGGGGHILGYPVLVPDSLESDSADKFGPVVPELNASEVRPKFEDVFAAPGARLCDVTAPIGLSTDPNTNLDWYLVPTYNSNQLVGLLQENGTTTGVLVTVTLTPSGSDAYDMTSSGWASTFPTVVIVTETGTATTVWADNPGTDRQVFTVVGLGGFRTYQVQWDIVVAVADPVDTLYQISFVANNRDDPQSGAFAAEGTNDLLFEYFFNGVWVDSGILIECAGANAAFVNTSGQTSYGPNTYTSFLPKETGSGSPRFLVRWNVQGNNGIGCDGEISAITINKFRYL